MAAAALEKKLQMDREALELVVREKDSPSLERDLATLLDRQRPDYPEIAEELPPTAKSVAAMTTPFFRQYLAYDPVPTIAKMSCPVLVIAGNLDHQVVPQQNLPQIEDALKAFSNRHTAR